MYDSSCDCDRNYVGHSVENVDIKIFGWEQGVGFDQEIEIVDGEITKNHHTEHKNYADWMWNTAMLYMGG